MKPNKTRRRLPLIIALLLVVLLGLTAYAYSQKVGPFSADTSSPTGPTQDQKETEKKTEASNKETFIESTKDAELPGKDVPVPSSNESIKITSSKEPGTVTIKTELDGYASGKCQLEVTNGSRSVTKTADIIYQPQFSTCAGFSVLTDEVGSGTWKLRLIVTPDGGSPIEKLAEVSV